MQTKHYTKNLGKIIIKQIKYEFYMNNGGGNYVNRRKAA